MLNELIAAEIAATLERMVNTPDADAAPLFARVDALDTAEVIVRTSREALDVAKGALYRAEQDGDVRRANIARNAVRVAADTVVNAEALARRALAG